MYGIISLLNGQILRKIGQGERRKKWKKRWEYLNAGHFSRDFVRVEDLKAEPLRLFAA